MSHPHTRGRAANLGYAIKSFKGFLEGTGHASHTIESYLGDLQGFLSHLQELKGGIRLQDLTPKDLDRYSERLAADGYRSNSRRRKILTLRRWFRYLKQRKKISTDISTALPAPHKVERVPHTINLRPLREKLRLQDGLEPYINRSRLLIWILAETGCRVSEVGRVLVRDIGASDSVSAHFRIEFRSGGQRFAPISEALYKALRQWSRDKAPDTALFQGFNRFGSLGGSITSRGVQLLLKEWASKLEQKNLTARMIRHSVVVEWFSGGVSREEIQKRLGLKSGYAFRVYEPIRQALGGREEQVVV